MWLIIHLCFSLIQKPNKVGFLYFLPCNKEKKHIGSSCDHVLYVIRRTVNDGFKWLLLFVKKFMWGGHNIIKG